MEEKPPQAGRDVPRARNPRAAFSTPEQPAPQTKPAERAPRRAAKAPPPVTFQPPDSEDKPTTGRGDAATPADAGRQPRKGPSKVVAPRKSAKAASGPGSGPMERVEPAKKAAAGEKAEPVEKVEPAKAAPVEKAEPAKAAPVQKAEPARAAPVEKAEPAKAAPVQKAEPAKKAAPVAKGEPAKKAAPAPRTEAGLAKKAEPANSAMTADPANKATPAKKAAPPKKAARKVAKKAAAKVQVSAAADPQPVERENEGEAAEAQLGTTPAVKEGSTSESAAPVEEKPANTVVVKGRPEPPARTPAEARAAATRSRTEAWAKIVADPGHAPELLALAATQSIGPRAEEWARRIREDYPTATDDALARLAVAQFTRFGGVSSVLAAVAGSYAPAALLGANALTYAEMILHVAAAYGLDPTDPKRAVELLVLTQVHPTEEDAEAALASARQPTYEEEAKLTDAVWRLGRMAAVQAAVWAVLRGVNRFYPGTAVLAAIMTSRSGARNMGTRATRFYGRERDKTGRRTM